MDPGPFGEALAVHRTKLLGHCYRMLGSFHDAEDAVQEALANAWKAREQYTGAAPLHHWLFRIATHVCLDARRVRQRSFPERAQPPSAGDAPIGTPLDADAWVTPAPDDALLGGDAARIVEERQSIALAFIALLQGFPPQQRAALLLKDVVGFSVDEIAQTLDISESAVASALHRARQARATVTPTIDPEPPPETLREYIRCWEARDIDGLVALLRADAILSMPPWTMWLQGRAEIRRFLLSHHVSAFSASGLRLVPTRANGQSALVFYRDRGKRPQSVQLVRSDGSALTELTSFIGETFLRGF